VVRRIGALSPTWRRFLRNEAIGIVAIDMFVAVAASFRLLYVTAPRGLTAPTTVFHQLRDGRRRIVCQSPY
jgi:hypothetical protein